MRSRAIVQPEEVLSTWSELAFIQLRRDLLAGRLAPGSKLGIEQLRVRYNVGSTPLREALYRLSSEGLVRIEQQKGFRVATVTLRELEELHDLRILIEAEAMRRATRFGDRLWEGDIVAAFYQLDRLEQRVSRGEAYDADEWEACNRAFHEALAAGADSSRLLRLRRELFDHFERYRRIFRDTLPAAPRHAIANEHRAMMDAALARRGDQLAALMTAHIGSVLDLLRASFAGSAYRPPRRAAAGRP